MIAEGAADVVGAAVTDPVGVAESVGEGVAAGSRVATGDVVADVGVAGAATASSGVASKAASTPQADATAMDLAETKLMTGTRAGRRQRLTRLSRSGTDTSTVCGRAMRCETLAVDEPASQR